MENEGEQTPSSGIAGSSSGGGSGGSTRPQVPQMSLYERQAVQALQALQRQPNAAAQYLQQMYAAQHQQLMLQQHLSSAQLQNLAAVQQVTLAANRQVNSANTSEGQSSGTAQSTVNLATTAVSQPSVRPQTVSSPVTSVLLGPTSSTSLSPSQAKMYLQAQVVARTLTRSAPLTHQLILMPGGSVAAVQPDLTAAGNGAHCETDQAQNLAVRGQGQGQVPLGASAKVSSVVVSQPSTVSPAQTVTITQASSLNLSQSASAQPQPSAKVVPSAPGDGEAGAKKSEHEGAAGSPSGGMNLTRTVTPAGHTLISSAATYTQIQPHSLLHQQLQQKQLVIQQQHLAIHQHRQSQLAQLHLSQAHSAPHTQTLVVQPLSQAQAPAPTQTEAHKQAQAQSEVQRPAQTQTETQKQAQPQSEAQKQVQVQTEAQKQVQAQSEGQKQVQAQSEAQRPVQVQNEAQKQAQVQSEAQKQVQAQSEAQRPAQAQNEAQKQAHTQSEPQKLAQTQTEAPKQAQPEAQRPGQGQAHPHAETEACTLPQKQAQTEVCPRKAPPAKGQASSSSSQLPASAKPVSGLGGGAAGQGQTSSAGAPAPVLQNSASTQTPVSGLSLSQGPAAQAQDWTQPPVEPACPQLHLPLKSAVMGVKRKAEDDGEELSFSNLGPPELSPSLSTAQDLKHPTPGKGDTIHSGPPVLTSVTSLLKVSRHGGDSKPPQAIVKPHILTHVIEGFVIQEGAEPFPVDSTRDQANCKQKPQEPPVLQPETQLSSQHPDPEPLQQTGSEVGPEMLKCEFCGRLEQAEKFKRSKRFCSMACAKRYNVSCRKGVRRFTVERAGPIPKETATRLARRSSRKDSGDVPRTPLHKRLAKGMEEPGRVSDNPSYEDVLPPSLALHRQPPFEREPGGCGGGGGLQELTGSGLGSANPALWSVEQVHEFIASLPGCQDLAEEFQLQEIDGQALLLLKEEHLMTTMNMKLGPALKICARINMLKES